MDGVQNMSCL